MEMTIKEGSTLAEMNCAHIFAESTNKDISDANEGSNKVRLSYFS